MDYKIDLSKFTIYDGALLSSPITRDNPVILIEIIDKYVDGGVKDRPYSELAAIMEQFAVELKLVTSPELAEAVKVAREAFGDA